MEGMLYMWFLKKIEQLLLNFFVNERIVRHQNNFYRNVIFEELFLHGLFFSRYAIICLAVQEGL